MIRSVSIVGWLHNARRQLVALLLATLVAEAHGHVPRCDLCEDEVAFLPQSPALNMRQPHTPEISHTSPPKEVTVAAAVQSRQVVVSMTGNWEALARVTASVSPVTDVSPLAAR